MNCWPLFERLRVTTLFALLLQGVTTSGQDGLEVYHQRFSAACNTSDVQELNKIAAQLSGEKDANSRGLAFLSHACATYHEQNNIACLAYLDSVELTLPAEQKQLFSWIHRMRAKVYKSAGDAERALQEIDLSLRILKGTTYKEEYASCLIIRAEIQRKLNDGTAAMTSLQEAREIAESIGFGPAICSGLLNRGNIHYDQGRYEEAWEVYMEALNSSMEHGLESIAQRAVMNLGAVAFMTDRYEHAAHLYDSIINTMPEQNSKFKGDLIQHSAHANEKLGNDRIALSKYAAALTMHQALNDSSGVAKTLQLRSTLKWKLGSREEAIAEREKALAIARKLKLTEVEKEALALLYEWYREVGRNEDALDALELTNLLSDSLAESRFNNDLANAEVRYDTERKERELALRNAQLAEEVAVSDRRSTQRNMLFGAVGLLLLLGFVGYRNIKHRQSIALKDKELSEQKVEEILRSQELRLVNAVMEGQEKERERVSKDLHDRLGSMLSSIKLQFSTLESRISDLQSGQESVYEKVLHMLDNAVGEVRRISRDMASGSLARFGLVAALTDLRESISIKGTLDVELSLFGLEERLDSNVEITAYRVIQELVSNALKHAKASELSINLTRSGTELTILVADNGVGFNTQERAKGMGLNNVQNRVSMLGGSVHVDSTRGKGTTVSVILPLATA